MTGFAIFGALLGWIIADMLERHRLKKEQAAEAVVAEALRQRYDYYHDRPDMLWDAMRNGWVDPATGAFETQETWEARVDGRAA